MGNFSVEKFDDSDIKNLIDISKNFAFISSKGKYLHLDKVNLETIRTLASLENQCKELYNTRHFWDGVTADVYKDGNCRWLWIYSNGLYELIIYKQDSDALPYHERMNLYLSDIVNCNVKNLPLIPDHVSKGKWVKNGSIYYFFPINSNNWILAGEDDKGRKYMSLNDFGNLEYFNTYYERVVMSIQNKDCVDCVNKNSKGW